jgi:hypothetical protein
MNTNEHKQRAAELGVAWADVLTIYREARELETADVERRRAIREQAYAFMGQVHGGRFKLAHRAAFNGGDATNIVGIDVAAAGLRMSADDLYAELNSPAPAMRPADDVMAECVDRAAVVATSATSAEDLADMMPLVQAAHVADVTEQWLRLLVKSGKIRGRKAGRNWLVSSADVAFFSRHATAGRPRREAAPF